MLYHIFIVSVMNVTKQGLQPTQVGTSRVWDFRNEKWQPSKSTYNKSSGARPASTEKHC